MAFNADPLSRALRGRPSLRRALRGADSGRLAQFEDANRDALNFKSLYRQRLADFAQTEAAARPINERYALEQRLAGGGGGADRDQLKERLRRNEAGFGSVAARFSPYNYGSVAERKYGSLYRR